MADKSAKKTVQLRVTRGLGILPKIIVASAFRIKQSAGPGGLIDLIFEGSGIRNERVVFEPSLLSSNIGMVKNYAAKIKGGADDNVQKEEIPLTESTTFSNIAHFSQLGEVAETNFGVYSLSDWVQATREQSDKSVDIQSVDAIRIISTIAFQKKLLNEFILAISENSNESP